MQTVGIGDDRHRLSSVGGGGRISVNVNQTICHIVEHVVDPASSGCRHSVAGGHIHRQLSDDTINIVTVYHVRRHAVGTTSTQEVDDMRHACAV